MRAVWDLHHGTTNGEAVAEEKATAEAAEAAAAGQEASPGRRRGGWADDDGNDGNDGGQRLVVSAERWCDRAAAPPSIAEGAALACMDREPALPSIAE